MKNRLTIFRIIWMFNAIVTAAAALIYAWMFVGGGSGPHNDAQWKWAFAFAAIVLWGSNRLKKEKRNRFAWLLLLALTLPALGFAIFIGLLLTTPLHWQ